MSEVEKFDVTLSVDEALVLHEYFERFDETDDLFFVHPAEYLVLQRIAGQVCKASAAMFGPSYAQLLADARQRVAQGFEGSVPCLRGSEA